jgi:anti-sigma factor RsiW
MEVQDGQPVSIQRWLSGKVDFAPRVPQLRKVSLIGARLSNVSDRPAAYITYGDQGERRVSLFVFDAPDLELKGGRRINDRQVLLSNQHGYNVVIWKDREIAYSLVSDLEEKDVLELVSASGH